MPTLDPLADHGRCYAGRLRAAGTPARLTEHPGAPHAFLSMPGVVPQAEAARAEIVEFLRGALAGRQVPARPAGKAAATVLPGRVRGSRTGGDERSPADRHGRWDCPANTTIGSTPSLVATSLTKTGER
ncbi:alpha/beta hydrolase [Streptosporangium roseum]|uniref:alpha/beta hydrolase n=1 Tax=Streptosporangium roseum TaxID=2001 RepID=UPI00331A9304